MPQLFAVVALSFCICLLWKRRREAPGAYETLILLICMAWWSAMALLEFCAQTIELKVLFTQLSYFGVVTAPWALLRFSLAFTDRKHLWSRTKDFVVLSLAAGLLLLAFTNPWTRWLWSDIVARDVLGWPFALYERGPLFGVDFAYCYILTGISSVILIRYAAISGGIFRWQSSLILLAILSPFITSLLYLFEVGPFPEVDYTPVGFAIGGLLFAWNLLHWRLFDLTPVAAHMLFDRMVDPVLVIDRQERLIKANASAMVCFSLDSSALGAPLREIFASDPDLASAFIDRHAFEYNGVSWSMETTLLEDTMAHSRGRLCVLRDISELMEARQLADVMATEARRASEAKSTFLAHVSHDLRTPVHAILAMTEMVAEGKDPASEDARNLGIIRDAGETLLRLVNDLLDINRIESGAIDLEDRPFCLSEVIDPVVSLLEPPARRKGLTIDLFVEPGLSIMRGDPDRFRQILFNLVGNAVKFSEQGAIGIRATRSPAGWLRVDVCDEGPGIDPAILPTLFDPFVRAKTERKKEGSGLGLTIVRRFTEAMGGTVSVANRPAKGLCMTLELPLLENG